MNFGKDLMPEADFQELFDMALTDRQFRQELLDGGFNALAARGYGGDVPDTLRATIGTPSNLAAGSRCGTCGVCGLCTLCAEINAGSGSAFLWATFFLGD